MVFIEFVPSYEDQKKSRKGNKYTLPSAGEESMTEDEDKSSTTSSLAMTRDGCSNGALRTSSCSSASKMSDDSIKRIDRFQKVQFKDFDIIEVIGEGSFGRVFKGRKKDDG
mmetsp:Transcript_30290/g.46303  ORF Transcript_30290/g.46303 Transcript_30290/m.46303 type:complete len:111 (-) Transcript_30290:39-371(-)